MKSSRSKITIFLFSIVGLALALSCTPTEKNEKYMFLGHTYFWGSGGSKIDPRLLDIDYSSYDRVWLGGDICSEASLDLSILEYLDDIFSLGKPSTQWAYGNHDIRNSNKEWLREITKKNTYNIYSKGKVTSVTLDLTLSPFECSELENQYDLINSVIDTISPESHLIFIMHHGIWSGIPDLPKPTQYGHSELYTWEFSCKQKNSTFSNYLYPKLVKLKNKGVNVICVMGDLGGNKKTFNKKNSDGIEFIGCGLNNSKYFNDSLAYVAKEPDFILEFDYNKSSNKIAWKFLSIDSIYGKTDMLLKVKRD